MPFRELPAEPERERGASLAFFDRIRRAHRGPDTPEDMDVIGLHRQRHNRPAFLSALLAQQIVASLAYLMYQHLSPAFGTPDEMVDSQM